MAYTDEQKKNRAAGGQRTQGSQLEKYRRKAIENARKRGDSNVTSEFNKGFSGK